MITLNGKVKAAPQQSSPLSLKTEKTSGNSFTHILQTLSAKSTEGKKEIQNGVLLLKTADSKKAELLTDVKPTVKTTKKADLASLLKTGSGDQYIIDPKIAASLDTASLKQILNDAKQYLKDKIKNSPEFQTRNIKQMPNTIKGLLKLAQSLHIDVSKITLTKVIAAKDHKQSLIQPNDVKTKSPATKSAKADNTQTKSTQTVQIDVTKTTHSNNTQNAQTTSQAATTTTTVVKKLMQTKAATTPLFQKITKNIVTHSTHELVSTKSGKTTTHNISAASRSSVLATLLHSHQNTKESTPKTTADISALSASHQKEKHDNNNAAAVDTLQPVLKHDGITHTSAADQTFAVKINEAKQMVKYLAHDVKHAIDNYKPPFTKIQVKLNPQKFGEVDLTVVQRGKNLHVNISSNSNAINALAQNASDLKVQLNQNGINNASLNFSNSGSLSDNASQQQQQQQQQQHARREYEQFIDTKPEEEKLASLEIVIPQYI